MSFDQQVIGQTNELLYQLNWSDAKLFPGLFGELEQHQGRLGIGTMGLSDSGLSDVFLKIGTEGDREDDGMKLEDGEDDGSEAQAASRGLYVSGFVRPFREKLAQALFAKHGGSVNQESSSG